jgi:hypothetical protein
MKPSSALFLENRVPIDVAGLQLRNCGVTAIRAAKGGTHPETALGKVESVANGAANAIVRDPPKMFQVDSSLEHQIFDQTADGVIGKSADDSGIQPETTAKAAGDVVFASAFPSAKMAGSGDAVIAGIEA